MKIITRYIQSYAKKKRKKKEKVTILARKNVNVYDGCLELG